MFTFSVVTATIFLLQAVLSVASIPNVPCAVPAVYLCQGVVQGDPVPKGGIEAIARSIRYPETAKRDSLQGKVILEVTIDQRGAVEAIKVSKGVREDLNAAAVEAVKKVRFLPGTEGSRPVKMTVTIPVMFRLQ